MSKSALIVFLNILFICFAGLTQTYSEFVKSDEIDRKCELSDPLYLKYVSSDLDSLSIMGKELLRFSNKRFSKKGINYAYFYIGIFLTRSAKEYEGIQLLLDAKNYFLSKEDYNKVTEIYNEIGNAYQYLGKLKDSYKWYEQSMSYGELASDNHVTYIAQINLAQAQCDLAEYPEAQKNAEEYRDWVLKLGTLKNISNAFAVLGKIKLGEKDYKRAVDYFDQSYKFAVRAGDNVGKGHAYTNLAISKYLQGNLEESEHDFKVALGFRKKVKNVSATCDAYLNYGGILFERKKYSEAIENYNKGLAIAEQAKKYDNQIELLEALREVFIVVDSEKIEQIDQDLKEAQKNKIHQETKQLDVVKSFSADLNESKNIRKNGFVNKNERWPFFVGAGILFLGFLVLIFRKKIN